MLRGVVAGSTAKASSKARLDDSTTVREGLKLAKSPPSGRCADLVTLDESEGLIGKLDGAQNEMDIKTLIALMSTRKGPIAELVARTCAVTKACSDSAHRLTQQAPQTWNSVVHPNPNLESTWGHWGVDVKFASSSKLCCVYSVVVCPSKELQKALKSVAFAVNQSTRKAISLMPLEASSMRSWIMLWQ